MTGPGLVYHLLVAASAAALPAAADAGPTNSLRVTATAGEMLAYADRLDRQGSATAAEAVLELLSGDANADVRNEARFRHAKLLVRAGELTEAAVLLRRVLDERPDAMPVRLELVRLLERLGDVDAAWRELRAARAAAVPPEVAKMIDRYAEALRAVRPAGGGIELAIAPDSNISRATRSDTLDTVLGDFTIAEESKARSGVGLAVRASTFRRLAFGQTGHSILARMKGSANLYRGGRFNDVVVDLAAGPEFQLGRGRLGFAVGATQRWFGQKPLARAARLDASWKSPLGSRSGLSLFSSVARLDSQVNDLQDGTSMTAELGFEHALSATTAVAFRLAADRMAARDPGYSLTGWRGGLFVTRDVGRATLTAGAEYGRLSADERLLLFPTERSDRYVQLHLSATMRQLSYGGFAPVTRLVIERNLSSIAMYDYSRTRTEFAVVRAF